MFLFLLVVVACASAQQPDLQRLKVPPGFKLSVFAKTDGPRLLAWSPGGVLMATDTDLGKVVAMPDPKKTGKAERVVRVLTGVRRPHGIAFHEGKLYIAGETELTRYDWDEQKLSATSPKQIATMPRGGHSTRTILFAPDGKLYLSIGSSCNACKEKDQRRAAVLQMNADGSDEKLFARGLRNAVGLVWNGKTGSIWATDNGTDMLGDDVPPEEVNDLGKSGGDFGWPFCFGQRTPDPQHGNASRCANTIMPKVEMQAHSAPLGLAFYTGTQWPQEYRGDLFVAFHGSWNRTIPTGYKVVRIHWNGNKPEVTDFLTGFLPEGARTRSGVTGRPVDVLFSQDGSTMYVSEDDRGYIYRITRE